MIEYKKWNETLIGKAWEYLVAYKLSSNWLKCFFAWEWFQYDLVVDTWKKLVRIQVKTTLSIKIQNKKKNTTKVMFFNLKRAWRWWKEVYKDGAFDYYALVCLENDRVFFIKQDMAWKKSISIRDDNTDYIWPSGHNIEDMSIKNFIKEILWTKNCEN